MWREGQARTQREHSKLRAKRSPKCLWVQKYLSWKAEGEREGETGEAIYGNMRTLNMKKAAAMSISTIRAKGRKREYVIR